MTNTMNINSLSALHDVIDHVPAGTTADILSSDLEAGNFETVRLEMPDGKEIEIKYTGPVAEGYVSPFEVGKETEEDL